MILDLTEHHISYKAMQRQGGPVFSHLLQNRTNEAIFFLRECEGKYITNLLISYFPVQIFLH
jgi:hypothetical protein